MNWEELKAEYVAGGIGYRKLAEKHRVSFSALKRIALKEGWHKLREQVQDEATTDFVKFAAEKQAERMKRIFTVTDKLLAVVEKVVDDPEQQQVLLERGVLKSLTGAVKDIKEIQDIKSPLDLEEQQTRIAGLKKKNEENDAAASAVEVIFAAGPPEWNE